MEYTPELSGKEPERESQSPITLPAGSVVDSRFEVVSFLGFGATSVVYLANDRQVDRKVALKLLTLDDGKSRARFLKEARTTSSLNHENIVKVWNFGTVDNERMYIACEYLQGMTLSQKLETSGRLTPAEAIPILMQVCNALEAAHERGIVHRDLKPSNIFLVTDPEQEQNTVKVLDFGIAKQFENTDSQNLTSTGGIVGSPAYMSPEQCSSKAVDARTDIYSLCVTAYEMLTGKLPFGGESVMELLMNKLQTRPQTISTGNVGPALERTILKGLEIDPEIRYQNAAEMREALCAPELLKVGRRKTINRIDFRVVSILALAVTMTAVPLIILLVHQGMIPVYLKRADEPPRVLFAKANTAIRENHLSDAESYLKEILRQASESKQLDTSVRANLNLGFVYTQQGQIEKARRSLNEAIDDLKKANYVVVASERGTDYRKTLAGSLEQISKHAIETGRSEEGLEIKILAERIQLDREHLYLKLCEESSKRRVDTSLKNGFVMVARMAEAEKDYRAARQTYNDLAIFCTQLGQMKEADQMFANALKLSEKYDAGGKTSDEYHSIVFDMGTMAMNQGKLDEADTLTHKALAMRFGDRANEETLSAVEAHWRDVIGHLRLKQRRFAEAQKEFSQAAGGFQSNGKLEDAQRCRKLSEAAGLRKLPKE